MTICLEFNENNWLSKQIFFYGRILKIQTFGLSAYQSGWPADSNKGELGWWLIAIHLVLKINQV